MPVLPGRDLPQHPRPALSLGHDRGRVGSLRAVTVGPAVAGRARRPSRQLVHARHRRRDPLPHAQWAGVAGLAGRLPARGHCVLAGDKWQADGSAERMHDDLRDRARLAAGREAAPTAAIIDSQSVKGSEMIGRSRRGYDAGKKINGTKRHLAVDVQGLLLTVLVTAASVQDRDAARPLLWNLRKAFPSVTLAWADGGYVGKLVTWAKTKLKPKLTLEIVKRPDGLHTFQVLPRRWVVERTLSWITRHRRTVRDYERLAAHHETYIYWAMIIVTTPRFARQPATTQSTAT